MLTLMTIAAEEGSEPEFARVRRRISTAAMPPDMKVDYFLHLGRAHRDLHHDDLAQIAFSKAIQLAEHHGLTRQLFEAERELRTVPELVPMRSAQPSESVAEVVAAIKNLRAHVLQEVG